MTGFGLCVFGKDTTTLMGPSPRITSGDRPAMSICPSVGDAGLWSFGSGGV